VNTATTIAENQSQEGQIKVEVGVATNETRCEWDEQVLNTCMYPHNGRSAQNSPN
jgi:hypothetical protein